MKIIIFMLHMSCYVPGSSKSISESLFSAVNINVDERPKGLYVYSRRLLDDPVYSVDNLFIAPTTQRKNSLQSNLISHEPSLMPSDAPSMSPSDIPSSTPSAEKLPSYSPASKIPYLSNPIIIPSMLPSTLPSEDPLSSESHPPSWYHSDEPTFMPSLPPSSIPSFAPTLECHDKASYRSPLNHFECHNHAETDCLNWRFLGLNVDQVLDLVESCPITCRIDCGSLQRFNISISFIVSNVASFLAPTAVSTLEAISNEVLTNLVNRQHPASRFFLQHVELLSQNISTRRLLRDSQINQGSKSTVNLMVSLVFRGYAIKLNSKTVEDYLLNGIVSTTLVRSLQRSGESAFLDVKISSNNDNGNLPQYTQSKDEGKGRTVVAMSTILSLLFVLCAIGLSLHFIRRQVGELKKTVSIYEAASDVVSPAVSVRSSLAQVFSFDSIRRALSSPKSNDSVTIEAKSSSQSASIKSQISTSSENEGEHPFRRFIPPMIVYDNVDEASFPSEVGGQCVHGIKDIFPAKRIVASPSIVACLKAGNGYINETYAYAPVHRDTYLFDSCSSDEAATALSFYCNSADGGKLMERFSVIEKADSVGSAPCKLTRDEELKTCEESASTTMRRCTSESEIGLLLSSRTPHDERRKHSCFLESDRASTSMNCHRSMSSGMEKAKIEKETFMGGIEPSGSRFIKQILTMTPKRKTQRSTSLADSVPYSILSSTPKRGKLNHHPLTQEPDVSRNIRKLEQRETGKHMFYQIPRCGKLGLTIICDDDDGPLVQQVKDYSPLLGKVVPNDRIISIDGVGTLGATLDDVTSLLTRKPGWAQTNTVDVMFFRPNPAESSSDNDCEKEARRLSMSKIVPVVSGYNRGNNTLSVDARSVVYHPEFDHHSHRRIDTEGVLQAFPAPLTHCPPTQHLANELFDIISLRSSEASSMFGDESTNITPTDDAD